MELSDIRAEVYLNAGIPSDDDRVDATAIRDFINGAIREISATRDWEWLKTVDATNVITILDQSDYTPPANWRRTIGITINNSRDIPARTPREINSRQFESGPVEFFTIEAGILRFSPKPDIAEDIRHVYLKGETALSAEDDEPLVPDNYIDLVIWGAVKRVHIRLKDTGSFRVAKGMYDELDDRYARDAKAYSPQLIPMHRTDTWGN